LREQLLLLSFIAVFIAMVLSFCQLASGYIWNIVNNLSMGYLATRYLQGSMVLSRVLFPDDNWTTFACLAYVYATPLRVILSPISFVSLFL